MVKRLSNALFVGGFGCILALTACGGSEGEETEGGVAAAPEVAEASPEAIAAANSLPSRLGNSDITLVPTQRGPATVTYTQPRSRRQGNFAVTTFRIRNEESNAIAGLTIDEFWFDVEGNTVTGDRVRYRQPILSGQVVDVELRVPRHPAMDRSNYEFTHQNGEIDARLLDELPEPEVEPEEEEEEEADTPDP